VHHSQSPERRWNARGFMASLRARISQQVTSLDGRPMRSRKPSRGLRNPWRVARSSKPERPSKSQPTTSRKTQADVRLLSSDSHPSLGTRPGTNRGAEDGT